MTDTLFFPYFWEIRKVQFLKSEQADTSILTTLFDNNQFDVSSKIQTSVNEYSPFKLTFGGHYEKESVLHDLLT